MNTLRDIWAAIPKAVRIMLVVGALAFEVLPAMVEDSGVVEAANAHTARIEQAINEATK